MIKRSVVVFLAALCMILMTVIPGYTQITQTGILDGSTFNVEGQLLPGVEVSVSSPALILPSMTTVSNEKGFFRFPSLPPGKYQVTFKMDGFKTLVQKGIIVSVGRRTSISGALELSTIQETIEVSGTTPTVDKAKTANVSNLGTNFLQNVPATRNLNTIFNMVPGVTGDTAHGSSVRDNSYNIDGVNVTDPVVGSQAGSFSLDIVEEMSVQTGGHTAEYGSVRGAVINVVTKSGGNEFHGMASFYYKNKDMQGDNTEGTIFEGQKSGFEYESEPDVNLGGPIIKDKVWFFISGSQRKNEEYLPGYPYNKQPENTPLDLDSPMLYTKITAQLSRNDRITLSYNFSDYKRNHRSASIRFTEDVSRKQETPNNVFNGQWTHFQGTNFVSNLKFAYMDYNLNLYAKNDSPRYYDTSVRLYKGSYGYDDLYTRKRFQALANGTLFVDDLAGRHEIKFGLEYEKSSDLRQFINNRLDNGLGAFIYTRYDGSPYYAINYQDFGREDEKMVFGGFIQDSWNPTDRLSVNIGLRFDHQEGIIPAQGEDREVFEYGGQTLDPRVLEQFKPVKWNTIAPRLGVTYDITGDGKTIFKASYGKYYAPNIMQYFITVNPNAFLSYYVMLDSNFDAASAPFNVSGQAAKWMDPDVKSPYVDEISIGIEREIFKDWRLSVRYIKKWDRELIEDVNITSLDYNALKNSGDLVWTNYEPVQVLDPYTGQMVTFYNQKNTDIINEYIVTNPAGAKRDYDGIEVVLDKRFSNRWQMNASYTYSKSTGLIGTNFDDSWSGQGYYNSPNSHINAIGNLELERRHQVKFNLTWMAPLGINVSCYYRYLGGRPYSRTISSDDLGLGLNQQNVDILAEERGSYRRPDISILDIKVEKSFKLPGKWGRLSVFVDIFNLFNSNVVTGVHTYSSYNTSINNQTVKFGEATGIYDPRIIRVGAKYQF